MFDRGDRVEGGFLVAREVDDYAGAEETVALRDRFTDAATRSSDERNLSAEIRHYVPVSEHHTAGGFSR